MVDDWPSYNEALVRRGEILLDLGLLQSWGEELEEMNRGKEGGLHDDVGVQLLVVVLEDMVEGSGVGARGNHDGERNPEVDLVHSPQLENIRK